jgi:hypothetical protein
MLTVAVAEPMVEMVEMEAPEQLEEQLIVILII